MRRLLNVFRGRRVASDIERELAFHVAERTDELMAAGMSRAAAERSARRALGHALVHRERARDADVVIWLDTLVGDVRYALASMRARPLHTAVLLMTLGLGIGANVAMFGIVRAVLLGPLPLRAAERVVTVTERRPSSNDANLPVSGHEFVAWQERNHTLERLALSQPDQLTLGGVDDPEMLAVLRVSADYFRLLGIDAARGRTYTPLHDEQSPEAVAVLSDAFWRRRFGGDTDIVGAPVLLNDQPYTVIGVMPPLPRSLAPDVWIPLDVVEQARAVGRHNLAVMGRLSSAATIAQAQSDLSAIAAQLETEMPAQNTDHHVHVTALRHALVGTFTRPLLLLMAAVAFVLLIACANVANLLLARATQRHREIAVRTAMGATRGRIVRQLLIESTTLAVLGGTVGVLIALWLMRVVAGITSVQVPLLETVGLDWQALAVAAGTSLVAGLLVGIAPALRWGRAPVAALREGSRTGDPGGRGVRAALITAEVALTLVLLVGTALMVNSFMRLTLVDAGFAARNLTVTTISLPASRYGEPQRVRAFADELLKELRAAPGVVSVGAVSHLPLGGADNWMSFTIDGRAAPAPGQEPNAPVRIATAGYFETMGIPLLSGRTFTPADARRAIPLIRWWPQQPYPADYDALQAAPVAVISAAAARQYWPGEDPVGRRIRILFSPEITIVGVVGDVRHNSLDQPAHPHVYLSHNQEPWSSLSFVVRTDGPAPIASLRERIRAFDMSLPVELRSMRDVRAASIARPRFFMLLVAAFGAVALALAVIGIAGVVSYVVGERTREVGVRVALGAQRVEILSMIVRQGMQPVLIGVAIGVAGALLLTRFMESLLFEVHATDPTTFIAAVGALVLVAALACVVPAWRATRMDAVMALRAE